MIVNIHNDSWLKPSDLTSLFTIVMTSFQNLCKQIEFMYCITIVTLNIEKHVVTWILLGIIKYESTAINIIFKLMLRNFSWTITLY